METVRSEGKPGLQLWIASSVTVGALVLFFFDPSRFHFYPVCVFHQATGLLCPGCGGLRAVHQLLHGHLYEAFRFNPLVFLGLIFLAGWLGGRAWQKPGPQSTRSSIRQVWYWIVPFLVLSLAFVVWRNVPGSFFATLPV